MSLPPSQDSHLIKRLQRGDKAALESLFRELHAPLCDFAYGHVRSEAVAEEIVQEVFFRLWQQRETPVLQVRAYLFASVKNACLQQRRHETLRERLARRFGFGPALAGVADAPLQADDALMQSESAEQLHQALEQLPPRTKQAMRLRWVDQRSHADIAGEMGISTKGVEKLLATGKRLLRDLYSRPPHARTPFATDERE